MINTLTKEHGYWKEFVAVLGEDWQCLNDHTRTLATLATLNVLHPETPIDIDSSLEYLKAKGGCCCDCEVIYNVILADKVQESGGLRRKRMGREIPRQRKNPSNN